MKEIISQRQAIGILTIFILGSSIIVGISSEAGQDSWLAQLFASMSSIPLVVIYARLMRLFPGMNLFDMLIALFGKLWGRLMVLLLSWYALHLGGLVIRNFSSFLKVIVMTETPQLAVMILFVIVVIYLLKSGIETFGKWSLIVFPFTISIAILTTLLALNQMKFSNILPIFGHSIISITSTAYKSLTFPYGETVLFLCLADAISKEDNPYKIYLLSILISTGVMLIIIIRNIALLGPALMQAEYFPSYIAVKIIKVGNFLQRIEGLLSMSFILAGIIKASLCVLAAAKGAAKFFSLPDYHQIIVPISLLALTISAIAYKNVMEMFEFLKYYQYYAIPFQFVIPICVWIAAEIKVRSKAVGQIDSQ